MRAMIDPGVLTERAPSPEAAPATRIEPSTTSKSRGIDSVLTRIFMRSACISRVEMLSESFRMITLNCESLKAAAWFPGDKVRLKLPGSFAARTFTPIDWDSETGAMRIIAYCHGFGPAGAWLQEAAPGQEIWIQGPQASLNLVNLSGHAVFFGDETSLGLATAFRLLAMSASRGLRARYMFEANASYPMLSALARLEFGEATVIERQVDDQHLYRMQDAMCEGDDIQHFVLTGRANSVRALLRRLESFGEPSWHFHWKTYWAPGKTGLD